MPMSGGLVRRARLGIVCALLAVPAAPAADAAAHFDERWTSYARDTSCGGKKDPSTFIFYGQTAHRSGSLNHFAFQTGWRGDGGSAQGFADAHPGCTDKQHWQRDSGCGVVPLSACYRYHIRGWQNYHYDSLGRWETVGTPHWEYLDWDCGAAYPKHHVPKDGFPAGRRRATRYFWDSHHNYVYVRRGNDDYVKQCKEYVHSDGLQTWLAVNHHNH
jgi:hypothetical protein